MELSCWKRNRILSNSKRGNIIWILKGIDIYTENKSLTIAYQTNQHKKEYETSVINLSALIGKQISQSLPLKSYWWKLFFEGLMPWTEGAE